MYPSSRFDRVQAVISEVQDAVLAAAAKLLVVDFDGTLAQIVDRPELATLNPQTRKPLGRLARRPDFVVAICSGRTIEDIRERAGIDNVIYCGNHGFEIQGRGLEFLGPHAEGTKTGLAAIALELGASVGTIDGVQIEEKGLSIAVHYRRAKRGDVEVIRESVRRIIQPHPGFKMTLGKMVFEVGPRVDWNKGKAATWIRSHTGSDQTLPIVLGDDVTDEDMFVELSDGVTIRVGLAGRSRAKYRLRDPGEVALFLAWLARSPVRVETRRDG
jgi:trehalose-phosphatase